MNRPIAQIVFLSSLSLLAATAALGTAGASHSSGSDLVGQAEVLASPPTTPPAPTTSQSTAPSAATTSPRGAEPREPAAPPLRLEVPSVGIDSGVIPVGKNEDGSMQLPGATQAGWYAPGPKIGGLFGSAVIAAHVDFNEVRGVFFDLRKVELGNEIIVTDTNGLRRSYIVWERFQVDKQELQIPEIFRTTGAPVLTLITCGGAFDTGERSYDDNIVLRAIPVQA